ncbi:unnamed protein product [Closterium sp. Naga37s-1]|nr:unnamed protein product [Closterium sp. Naga37s-1]
MSQLRSLLTPLTQLRGVMPSPTTRRPLATLLAWRPPRVSRLGRLRHLRSLLLWTLELRLLELGLGVPSAVDTGAETEGHEPAGAGTERTEPAGAGTERTEPAGAGTERTEPASAGTEGTEPACAGTEGTQPEGTEPGGTETLGADSGGAETSGADSGGAASPSGGTGATRPGGTTGGTGAATGAGGARATTTGGTGAGQPPQPALLETLSPQAIRAWFVRRGSPGGGGYGTRGTAGAGGAAGAGGTGAAAGAGGAGGAGGADPGGAGAGGTGGARATGPGGARTGGAGAGGGGTGGAGGTSGARGAGAVGARGAGVAGATGAGGVAGGTGGAACAGGTGATGALRHLLSLPPGATGFPMAGTTPPLLCPLADQSQPPLLPQSPLPAPAPYTAVSESLTERREPETRASTPERREPESSFDLEPEPRAALRARVPRVRRQRAPAVPGTHDMTLRPSSVPRCVVLPLPPASSLPDVADPPSDLARASSPTVTRLLATVVTDPTFSSPAASALVAELVDFAAVYRLDYLASLVSDPVPACPPSVGGETALGCTALGCDVLEDRQEELECLAAASPHHATMLLAPEGDPDALGIPTRAPTGRRFRLSVTTSCTPLTS